MNLSEACETLVQWPEEDYCRNQGHCVLFGEDKNKPGCNCTNDEWTGVGDFTPSYSLHCDLHVYSLSVLWWGACYLNAVLLIYSLWLMVKCPKDENSPSSGNNNNNVTEIASTTLDDDSNRNSLAPDRLGSKSHPRPPSSQTGILALTDVAAPKKHYRKKLPVIIYPVMSGFSASAFIILSMLKALDGKRYGIGRDLFVTICFSFAISIILCAFSARFYDITMETHSLGRVPESTSEWEAVQRSQRNAVILFVFCSVGFIFVSFLPLSLLFEDFANSSDMAMAAQVILIVIVLVCDLLIFVVLIGHALALSPLKYPSLHSNRRRGESVLRTLSRTMGERLGRSRSPRNGATRRDSASAPPLPGTALGRGRSPTPTRARQHHSRSPVASAMINTFGSSSSHAVSPRNADLLKSKNDPDVPPLINMSLQQISETRVDRSLSHDSVGSEFSVPWSVSYTNSDTFVKLFYALLILLLGLPFLGFVAWPFFAYRVTYALPILVFGCVGIWVWILRSLNKRIQLPSIKRVLSNASSAAVGTRRRMRLERKKKGSITEFFLRPFR